MKHEQPLPPMAAATPATKIRRPPASTTSSAETPSPGRTLGRIAAMKPDPSALMSLASRIGSPATSGAVLTREASRLRQRGKIAAQFAGQLVGFRQHAAAHPFHHRVRDCSLAPKVNFLNRNAIR